MSEDIEFYFDFLSPYSYLAWQWVKKYRSESSGKGHNIIPVPVPLATVIKSYETKGPAEIVPKRNYLMKECLRFTKLNQIPFKIPKPLPFNSLYSLRMALEEVSKENQFALIEALFQGSWGSGLDIGNTEVLTTILSDLGLDSQYYLDQTSNPQIRKKLKENVVRALAHGVFGVPTFVIGEELFWGKDSIPYLELFLNGKDPLDINLYKEFLKTL